MHSYHVTVVTAHSAAATSPKPAPALPPSAMRLNDFRKRAKLPPSRLPPASLDNALQALQHQDKRRSLILHAMDSKAPSARSSLPSVENYFENAKRQAQHAHKYK